MKVWVAVTILACFITAAAAEPETHTKFGGSAKFGGSVAAFPEERWGFSLRLLAPYPTFCTLKMLLPPPPVSVRLPEGSFLVHVWTGKEQDPVLPLRMSYHRLLDISRELKQTPWEGHLARMFIQEGETRIEIQSPLAAWRVLRSAGIESALLVVQGEGFEFRQEFAINHIPHHAREGRKP